MSIEEKIGKIVEEEGGEIFLQIALVKSLHKTMAKEIEKLDEIIKTRVEKDIRNRLKPQLE